MRLICSLLVFVVVGVRAQSVDTLRTLYLSEVVVNSTIQEGDTLQNFFRANKSATTEDILSRLQGVYLIRRGNYGQEPMLRGMTGGQINLTIDGMKMFGACTDKMDPVSIYIEPQNLKSIQAVLGSDGSRLGTTVGGSVDMQLAQPFLSSQPVTGRVGVGYQSAWNGFNTYANVNYSQHKSAYNLSLNYRKADDYRAGGGEVIPYSQYEKMNLSAGGKWSMGKDTLLASALVDDGWNIGFPALPMDVGSAKARIYSLGYNRYRAHETVQNLNAKIYYNSVFHSMDDTQRENVEMHMDMPGTSTTGGGFVEGNFHPAGKHTLSFRTDYYHNQVLAEMTMYPEGASSMYMQTWPASGRSVTGIYLNDVYKINRSTQVAVNGRIDWAVTTLQEGFGMDQLQVFYPNVQSAYQQITSTVNGKVKQLIRSNWIAEVHVGYGERLPTLSENFGFYLFNRYDGFDYIGQPDLVPEKNWSTDLTLSYFSDHVQLTITGFYNYLPDYIFASVHPELSVMTPGANGVKIYENIPSATLVGGEASLLTNFSKHFQFITALKYTHGQDFEGTPLPLIPPLTSNTTLRYTIKNFNIQLENESASSQQNVSPSYGEDETVGYSIFNLRSGYKINWNRKQLYVNAGIENMFDKNYHNHLDWGNLPRPGRNINVTIEFVF
jgi:iron complex outermembrane receptor protein